MSFNLANASNRTDNNRIKDMHQKAKLTMKFIPQVMAIQLSGMSRDGPV